MKFDELLQKKMKELNITGYKLSQLSGISTVLIYGILRGQIQNPRIDTVVRLAQILNIDLNELK